jgi:hypothetical protein
MAITKIPAAGFTGNNFRNIIINGDMSIAQRGTSASIGNGDTGYHTVDRYKFTQFGTITGEFTQSQSTDVPTGQGFATSLKMDCTTADTSLGSDHSFLIDQRFEGQNLQYLKKGTASAESLTVSFWVKSSKIGTYICEIYDRDNSRGISKAYTINTADTWEKKTITFAGDTTGAFDNDNGDSLRLHFWLGAGSDWNSGTLRTSWGTRSDAGSATGQVNLADDTANEWYVTGVQLEAGTTASDFEFLPFDVNLGRCQRYFFTEPNTDAYHGVCNGYFITTTLFLGTLSVGVPLRSSPSLSISGNFVCQAVGADLAGSSFTINDSEGNNITKIQIRATVSGATAGQGTQLRNNNDTSAKFQLSSEL